MSHPHQIGLGTRISIGNWEGTLFWLDPWLGRFPLHAEYPDMFAVCADPMLLVAWTAHSENWNTPFRRTFVPEETLASLMGCLATTLLRMLRGSADAVSWHVALSGLFSIGSAYRALGRGPALAWTTPLWKAPLPLKIDIFHVVATAGSPPLWEGGGKTAWAWRWSMPNLWAPESGAHICFHLCRCPLSTELCPWGSRAWVAGPGPGWVHGILC